METAGKMVDIEELKEALKRERNRDSSDESIDYRTPDFSKLYRTEKKDSSCHRCRKVPGLHYPEHRLNVS